jgi:flagellar hook assembly protein FlgD/pimeloyl-ACP methyl ester carboxylesterase
VTAAGAMSLEARLVNSQTGAQVRTLPLAGAGPTYTAAWDGRDASGAVAPVGTYNVAVFAVGGAYRYGRSTSVQLSIGVSSVSASPNPFVPTGSNATTITVEGTPGQIGMTVGFGVENCNPRLPLVESAPGRYTGHWAAVGRPGGWVCGEPFIFNDGTYSLRIYDGAGQVVHQTSTVRVTGVSQVTRAPERFVPAMGQTTAITVTAAVVMSLEARLFNSQTGAHVRTLPLAGAGPTYTAAWDGRDSTGGVAPVGIYRVVVFPVGGAYRYVPDTSVQLSMGVTSVSASPNPFVPTGSNAATVTVEGTPGQTGLTFDVGGGSPCEARPALAETTPGRYTGEWSAVVRPFGWTCHPPQILQDGTYSLRIYDGAGQVVHQTSTVRLTGVSQVTRAPDRFALGGGNLVRITAVAAGGISLDVRVINAVTNLLTASLQMAEASGSYTAEWPGRDSNGNFTGPGTYRIQIFHRHSGQRYSPETSVIVEPGVFSIEATPNPFVPTGANVATITTRANAGLSGLRMSLVAPSGQTVASGLPLLETGSVGTYVGTWDGRSAGVVSSDGQYTIRVFDASGNQFGATGTLTVASARSLTVTPNPFEPGPGRTAAISADVVAGLELEVRIGAGVVIPLTATGATYSASWNGTDSSGNPLAAGSYTAFLHNRVTGARYSLSTGLTISDSTPPETTITAGPSDDARINSRDVTFAWSGTDNTGGAMTYAHRLDGGPLSAFSADTGRTFTGLPPGPHTFEVVARDSSGNTDPSPATRRFVVADRSYTFQTSAGGNSFAEGARVTLAAYAFDTAAPSVPLTSAAVGVSVTVTDPALQTVLGPTALVFSAATGQFSLPFDTLGRILGAHQATFTFRDSAGELIGTETLAFDIRPSFSLTAQTDRAAYDRGQTVEITGHLSDISGPLRDTPVTLVVTARGFSRTFHVVSNPSGDYQFLFNPLANEAGRYAVLATASVDGLTKTTPASFLIHGLYLEPSRVIVDFSANSTQDVALRVHNLGETPLTGIAIAVEDVLPQDGVTAALSDALIVTLAPGAVHTITLRLTATSDAPPAEQVSFNVTAASTENVSEAAVVTASVQPARPVPVIEPASAVIGMQPGTSRQLSFTVRNDGFAPMANTRVSIADATRFGWIVAQEPSLGDVQPGAARAFGLMVAPPAELALGTYVVRVVLTSDAISIPLFVTVEITTEQVAPVLLQVSDDTGSDVSGAQVALVSTSVYQRVTPGGVEPYNKVYQGTTNAGGQLSLTDVAAGRYSLRVISERHAAYETTVVIEAGTVPQELLAILSTRVVDFSFRVAPTTIRDEYDVSLVVTYSTQLVKPALVASPSHLPLSFFAEDGATGEITISNSHSLTPVTNVVVDASRLDSAVRQLRLEFAGTQSTIVTIAEIAPGETVRIPFRALLPLSAPDLSSRDLGTINISGNYVFSLRGQALQGTTESAIHAAFSRPNAVVLRPSVEFVNDETDGIPNNLAYQGTTYQLALINQRDMPLTLHTCRAEPTGPVCQTPFTPSVLVVDPLVSQRTALDDAPLSAVVDRASFWSAPMSGNRLLTRGDSVSFDIRELERSLESRFNEAVSRPMYFGVAGTWDDETSAQGFLFPISIRTIRPGAVVITQSVPGGGATGSGGGGGGSIPQSFNNHGQIKIQIDQRVSLERQAFNATLDITPAVPSVHSLTTTLVIRTSNGENANALFVISPVQTPPSPLTGPGRASWMIIPTAAAGGTEAAGLAYTITAHISYAVGGNSFTFDTAAETFTVRPLPELEIEYSIPYVVMGTIPFNVGVTVTNRGPGVATNVRLVSAQPRIIENANNLPIAFGIDGSSSTGQPADFQPGAPTIEIPHLAPGQSQTAYWQMHATRRGFVVGFESTLTHIAFNGQQLDPLLDTSVRFVPALGGTASLGGCDLGNTYMTLSGTNGEVYHTVVNPSGEYFFAPVQTLSRVASPQGHYTLHLRQGFGPPQLVDLVDIVAKQPNDFVDFSWNNASADGDADGLPDCWEVQYGLDPRDASDAAIDSDGDLLTNLEEFSVRTNPLARDTDGDGVLDTNEILGPAGFKADVGNRAVYLKWHPTRLPVSAYTVRAEVSTAQGFVAVGSFLVGASEVGLTVTTLPTGQMLDNGSTYRFALGTARGPWSSPLSDFIVTRPGELVVRPPTRPLILLHGFGSDSTTWRDTTHFLTNTLHWRFGGRLFHEGDSFQTRIDRNGDFIADAGDALDGQIDVTGSFFAADFGHAKANYSDGRGISHQGDEVEYFLEALQNAGVNLPATIVAHSNGGLAARSYLSEGTRREARTAFVQELITYGTPHRGADIDGTISWKVHWPGPTQGFYFLSNAGSLLFDGARDARFACGLLGLGSLRQSDFLNRARPLPAGIRYGAIVGHWHPYQGLRRLIWDGHRGLVDDCHSKHWDGLVPISSANLSLAEVTADPVAIYQSDRFHTAQGGDFSSVLCALDSDCTRFSVRSPVELEVISPSGERQGRTVAEIPGASFVTIEDEGEEHIDQVIVPFPVRGTYRVRLTPKAGALPEDTFTLEIDVGGVRTVLAQDVRVADMPSEGYVYRSTPAANATPVAVAGSDIYLAVGAALAQTVRLDGSASRDPDGDLLTYTWSGPFEAVSGRSVTVTLPLGIHILTLTVDDGRGGVATDMVTVTVADTSGPVVSPPSPLTTVAVDIDGTRASSSALSAFLAGGSAADTADASPVRLTPQVQGADIHANTLFSIGTTPVTFRFRDASGNIGMATSNVTVVAPPSQWRIFGSGYNFPETTTYRASVSIDASGPSAPVGSVQYSYTRTRMNFVSSSITSFTANGPTVTIQGTGTVNGVAGYTFTATATDGSPDAFAIVIRRPDGTVHFSSSSKPLAGGALTLSSQ